MENPLLTASEEPFAVGISDFASFNDRVIRNENGAILLCREGTAEATVDQYDGTIRPDTLVLLLPGTLIRIFDRTDDFRMEYCTFTEDLFIEIAGRFDHAFFRILKENPLFDLPETMVEGMRYWFQIVGYTYRDKDNLFRNIIIRNRLQNLFLEAYDKMQRFSTQFRQHRDNEISTRQSELRRRFIALVKHTALTNEAFLSTPTNCTYRRVILLPSFALRRTNP